MYLEIISPEKKVFAGEVTSVKVPGKEGVFEVLNNHAPIISALANGQVRVKDTAGKKMIFDINGGVVEVLKNKIVVLEEPV